jgi:hypothetical protein
MDAGEDAEVGSAFEARLERVSGGYLRGVDGFGERSLRFAVRTGASAATRENSSETEISSAALKPQVLHGHLSARLKARPFKPKSVRRRSWRPPLHDWVTFYRDNDIRNVAITLPCS